MSKVSLVVAVILLNFWSAFAGNETLLELNKSLRGESDLLRCEEYMQTISHIALKQDSLDRLAESHFVLGYKYRKSSDYKNASKHYRLAKKYYTKTNNLKQLERVLENIGRLYIALYDFKSAEFFYTQALEVNENIGDDYQIALSIKDIAYTYRERDKFSESLEKYKKAYDMLISMDKKKDASNLLIDIGIINYELKLYNEANDNYYAALQLYDHSDFKKAKVYNNSAKAYFKNGEKKKAYKLISQAIEMKRSLKDSDFLVTSLNNLGIFSFKDGDYETSIKALVEAYNINNLTEFKGARGKSLYISLSYLDSISVATRNPGLIASLDLEDKHSRLAVNSVNQLLHLEMDYNIAVAEDINKNIRLDRERQERYKVYKIVGMVLAILLTVLAVWIIRNKKKLSQMSNDLNAASEDFKIMRKMINALKNKS